MLLPDQIMHDRVQECLDASSRPHRRSCQRPAPVQGGDGSPRVDRRIDFDRDVRPILAEHCYACHGPSKQKGGLRLDRQPAAFQGGDSGPVIVPGKADDSLVVRLTAGLEEDRVMPPKGERLASQQVAALRG